MPGRRQGKSNFAELFLGSDGQDHSHSALQTGLSTPSFLLWGVGVGVEMQDQALHSPTYLKVCIQY